VGLELCEGHFDGVKVRAVGWQEQHPGTFAPDSPLCGFALVARQVVEDDDIARLENWQELGFDIGLEDRAVHRGIDDPGCDQAIASEARHEGLRPPVAKGSLGIQPLALSGPATQAGHLGRRAGLVDKDQPMALLSHDGLAGILPRGPGAGQFRPVLFACSERFF